MFAAAAPRPWPPDQYRALTEDRIAALSAFRAARLARLLD